MLPRLEHQVLVLRQNNRDREIYGNKFGQWLYILRSSNLPDDLARKFVEADKLFLRDENED